LGRRSTLVLFLRWLGSEGEGEEEEEEEDDDEWEA